MPDAEIVTLMRLAMMPPRFFDAVMLRFVARIIFFAFCFRLIALRRACRSVYAAQRSCRRRCLRFALRADLAACRRYFVHIDTRFCPRCCTLLLATPLLMPAEIRAIAVIAAAPLCAAIGCARDVAAAPLVLPPRI